MYASTLIGLAALATASASTFPLRAMTYNIRYASDNPTGLENPWSVRRPLMAAQLNYETAGQPDSLLCMQEVLYTQVEDLSSDLGDSWTYVGIGRDDGVQAGEFAPIFYQPASWELVANETYWLSETPDVVGSVGWDAALPRIVNVASLRHVETGTPFVMMCTHFDHIGTVAREESAKLLVEIAEQTAADAGPVTPVLLGGDLNVQPDNPAYATLIEGMSDAFHVVPEEKHHGHELTYTGFEEVGGKTRIDYIFAKDPTRLEWVSFAVLHTRFDDGIHISDHRPVVVDVRVPISKCQKRRQALDL